MPLYPRKSFLFIRHDSILLKVPMEDRSLFPQERDELHGYIDIRAPIVEDGTPQTCQMRSEPLHLATTSHLSLIANSVKLTGP